LDVLNSVFALAGQPLTASDVDDFLNNQVITIPTGSVGIPGISDFDFDLADFGLEICGDLSNMGACFTVVDCNEPCDPAVCNNVTYTITSFDWTGLDDQFTLGTEGADTDLELAYTINGVPYQLDGGAAGSDAQASGQTITGATSPPPPGTVSYEVCFWENDCGNDADYDNDTGLLGPCLGNADDPFGDSANEGAATACEMITFDIAANTATGTNYTVNYTVTCEPIAITNVMPMPDAVCNGDNAEYTVCFDVAGGSGNYDLVEAANTATVLGTVAGADGNLCIGPVTIAGPTAASTLDVTVVDQANVLCLGNTTTINIPTCPVTGPMCEITDITPGAPVCAADGLTYDVTLTVTGADASVMLDDGTGPVAAVTTTFTFNSGAGYTINVTDVADGLCAFGPFTGVDPACPTGPTPFTFSISDPCNCANGIDEDMDGINDFALETITFNPGSAPYDVTDLTGSLIDSTGVPLLDTDIEALIAAADPGTGASFDIEVYLPADGTSVYSIEITDGNSTVVELIKPSGCPVCPPINNIPTVGEWGLIILGLLMSITAVVGIRQRREEEAYS